MKIFLFMVQRSKLAQLSDKLFWKCYRQERKIAVFLSRDITPFFQKTGALLFAISLVFITVPSMWFAQLQAGSPVSSAIEPAIGAASYEVGHKDAEIRTDTPYGDLPRSSLREPRKFIQGVVTFYCSDPRYTDDTPFITANGARTRFGIAASNIVDFNTHIRIPEVFGDTPFVVMDRMNSRYNNKPFFDIWVGTCEEAKERGVHYTIVGIY